MALPPLVGIGALASGIGSLFGIGRGSRQNKRNVRNMRMQHEMDKQMFDYQNAYNTPAKQMQRLKAAGLNPALMYGQGTTGNASGYPQTKQLPAYMETPVDTGTIVQGALATQQLLQSKAQTKKINEEANLTHIQGQVALGRKEYDIARGQAELDNVRKQTAQVDQNIKNLVAQKLKVNEETAKIKLEKMLSKLELTGLLSSGAIPSDHTIFKALLRISQGGIDTFINGLKGIFPFMKPFLSTQSEQNIKNEDKLQELVDEYITNSKL